VVLDGFKANLTGLHLWSNSSTSKQHTGDKTDATIKPSCITTLQEPTQVIITNTQYKGQGFNHRFASANSGVDKGKKLFPVYHWYTTVDEENLDVATYRDGNQSQK
jgi:hypothetical protein